MHGMQLCLAYRNEGGRVIVVLSLVPKTEMEETFRFIIPQEQRFGSTFVFRQGNPLLPDALRVVAASSAAATVIVSDTSRHGSSSCMPAPAVLSASLSVTMTILGACQDFQFRSSIKSAVSPFSDCKASHASHWVLT